MVSSPFGPSRDDDRVSGCALRHGGSAAERRPRGENYGGEAVLASVHLLIPLHLVVVNVENYAR
jgi:hypothetical protein